MRSFCYNSFPTHMLYHRPYLSKKSLWITKKPSNLKGALFSFWNRETLLPPLQRDVQLSLNLTTFFFTTILLYGTNWLLKQFLDLYKNFPVDDYYDLTETIHVLSGFIATFSLPILTLIPIHCFIYNYIVACTPLYFLNRALWLVLSLANLVQLCFSLTARKGLRLIKSLVWKRWRKHGTTSE